LTDSDKTYFTHITCAVGTGGTISGLINSLGQKQQIIRFSSLKGAFLSDVICNFVLKTNWNINEAYHAISFEREPYKNEKDLDYLKKKSFWSFLRYID
jgi:hypothetical protein